MDKNDNKSGTKKPATKKPTETKKGAKTTTLRERWQAIVSNLAVAKHQEEGDKYAYRSVEEIIEELKPLLKEHKVTLLPFTKKRDVMGERLFFTVTATIIKEEDEVENGTEAMHGEGDVELAKDSSVMSISQLSKATTSFAKKEALEMLFLIDDSNETAADKETEDKNKSNSQTQLYKKVLADMDKLPAAKIQQQLDFFRGELEKSQNKEVTSSGLNTKQLEEVVELLEKKSDENDANQG